MSVCYANSDVTSNVKNFVLIGETVIRLEYRAAGRQVRGSRTAERFALEGGQGHLGNGLSDAGRESASRGIRRRGRKARSPTDDGQVPISPHARRAASPYPSFPRCRCFSGILHSVFSRSSLGISPRPAQLISLTHFLRMRLGETSREEQSAGIANVKESVTCSSRVASPHSTALGALEMEGDGPLNSPQTAAARLHSAVPAQVSRGPASRVGVRPFPLQAPRLRLAQVSGERAHTVVFRYAFALVLRSATPAGEAVGGHLSPESGGRTPWVAHSLLRRVRTRRWPV